MYVYKITIEVNGVEKYYIGKCSTGDPDYKGSGKILKAYYKKYGFEIIKEKQILFQTDDIKKLDEAEKYHIHQANAIQDKNYLNIASGGEGGNTFAGLTKSQISNAMQKRQEFFKIHPQSLERRIRKFKETMRQPHIKEKMAQLRKEFRPISIEKYKITCSNRTDEQRAALSKKLSEAQVIAQSNMSQEQKHLKKQKEMLTKQQRTPEQRKHESALKGAASIRAAKERKSDPQKQLDYSKRVSDGVKRWLSTLTAEQLTQIRFRQSKAKFQKRGFFAFEQEVRVMMNEKTSLEIFHFLKNQGLHTHHICVKNFIEFLKRHSSINA